MELTPLEIEGAWLAKSPVWDDTRGSFREWFKSADIFTATGFEFDVMQANFSLSARGVIRGIHYSLAKGGQAKWITCMSGAIRDVIVDIRPNSPTFGKYIGIDLVAGDGKALLIGTGLGHGFVSREDGTIVSYLLTSPYSPENEFEINPLDSKIAIDWNLDSTGENSQTSKFLFSAKDAVAPTLVDQMAAGLLPN